MISQNSLFLSPEVPLLLHLMQICERFCPCFQEKYVEYVTNITNSKKAGNIYFESDVVGLNIFGLVGNV